MKYKLGDTVRVPIAPVISVESMERDWEFTWYKIMTGRPHPDAPPEYKDILLDNTQKVNLVNENFQRQSKRSRTSKLNKG